MPLVQHCELKVYPKAFVSRGSGDIEFGSTKQRLGNGVAEINHEAFVFKSAKGRVNWPYERLTYLRLQQPIFGNNFVSGYISDAKLAFKIYLSR